MRVEPTVDDVDELVGPATPHFAMQIRARVRDLVRDLPADHPVRRYADEKIAAPRAPRVRDLEGGGGAGRAAARLGWEEIPSHATASDPQSR